MWRVGHQCVYCITSKYESYMGVCMGKVPGTCSVSAAHSPTNHRSLFCAATRIRSLSVLFIPRSRQRRNQRNAREGQLSQLLTCWRHRVNRRRSSPFGIFGCGFKRAKQAQPFFYTPFTSLFCSPLFFSFLFLSPPSLVSHLKDRTINRTIYLSISSASSCLSSIYQHTAGWSAV